ncbi:3'(2'),5'-bisphosphate nucleotidase CysQ [Williamsia sterculiae]|uniref:3'(2'),5-bisphosphonucleoside 3'(2')-phosphohydrolase n=1 Tax=Williamsia sterculiae TaxID=1344003 RepID=A0A1N7DHP4_9NOCA|nr:3'(2'),5'-bisphosphate nucleotidase CysQ [Williamsia sterculiae]SIR75321.1 3'(2'),5'-bisphosphate nucleotidase [Williamsia sterculiae]
MDAGRRLRSNVPRHSDLDLAAHIAEGAGRILLGVRHQRLLTGRALGDVGDAMAQQWIAAVLRTHRPDDAVLSEEAPDDPVRLRSRRVWVIDPLDGTSEFSRGTDDWAVHIALTVDGRPDACAVSLPGRGELYRTDVVDPLPDELSGRMVTSLYGAGYESAWVARALGLRMFAVGSAGAKAMAVVRGAADAYVHGGGQYEWDNCAPVGVAEAAGLHCSRLDGSALLYNRPDPYLPDFVICRMEIRDRVLESLAQIW